MPYVSPAAVTSGAVISKTTFGDVVKADLDYLANPPACRVFHNASQSVANGGTTTLAFNSERYDTNTMHDNVTNNSRITFTTAGLYIITANIEFAAGTDYANVVASIRLNGTTFIAGENNGAVTHAASAANVSVTTTYKFAAADYVELLASQVNGAGTARNVVTAGNRSPEFAATWIGLG